MLPKNGNSSIYQDIISEFLKLLKYIISVALLPMYIHIHCSLINEQRIIFNNVVSY